MAGTPETLLEAVTYFSDLDRATEYVASVRWPEGFVCPACGGKTDSRFLPEPKKSYVLLGVDPLDDAA